MWRNFVTNIILRMRNYISKVRRGVGAFLFILKNKKHFGYYGNKVRVYKPLQIDGINNIYLRENVRVHEGTWLAAIPITGNCNVKLEIGKGSSIGHFNHIFATQSIVIEKEVLTADKVYISDNQHGYEDINISIIKQPIIQCRPVTIGEGSWLGENACVIGASIGKHSVIGANSVVIHDIPDYCIAVGAPARVVKKYDFQEKKWKKVM